MIGDGGESSRVGMHPDFVATSGLPSKHKTKRLQPLDDLTVLEARKSSHKSLRHHNGIVKLIL